MREFELGEGFVQAEASGGVRLDRFEALYERLFADAMEDGVISVEERAELDKTADSLGLDRRRLRKLEEALSAAYLARHGSSLREVADEAEPAASLSPLLPTTQSLQTRVVALEARVRELEHELEEARANVAVDIDLSGVTAGDLAEDESVEDLARKLRHDPRDASLLHRLFHAAEIEGDADRRWCAAQVLVYLGSANEAERAAYASGKTEGLIRPTSGVEPTSWRRLLAHPDEEVLVGEIFSVVTGAVLLGRISALRHQRALPTLDPARRQEPATSTVQAVRCFSWAASLLGLPAPSLYADVDYAGAVEMVPGIPPVSRLGKAALSSRSASELAFIAGRHLAWYRAERFMRLLVPSIQDLEDVFLAALTIGNPGLPMSPGVKQRVAPIAAAIEPILEPPQVDRLRGHFLRFVEEGGRANLQRWSVSTEHTASRAGLLLANDLSAAEAMLEVELGSRQGGAEAARAQVDDLLVFLTSDRATKLRRQLGIAVA